MSSKGRLFTTANLVNDIQKVAANAPAELSQRYDFVRKLGEGSFSTVYVLQEKGAGERVACKVVANRNHDSLEVALWSSLKHDNIVRFISSSFRGSFGFILMELMVDGELFDHIIKNQHYSERKAASMIKQVLRALAYLHERNIAHRDLKPENLLCIAHEDFLIVKIADFGLACEMGSERAVEQCGTLGYVAPEVLLKQHYGVSCDLFSIGIILYILLCGTPPFDHPDERQLILLNKDPRFSFANSQWDGISDSAKTLICQFLEKDPAKRTTAAEALESTWLKHSTEQSCQHLNLVVQELQVFLKKRLRAACHVLNAVTYLQMEASKRRKASDPTEADAADGAVVVDTDARLLRITVSHVDFAVIGRLVVSLAEHQFHEGVIEAVHCSDDMYRAVSTLNASQKFSVSIQVP